MLTGTLKNERVIIFGNSGSGKSFLAQHLSNKRSLSIFDLDKIYWRDEFYRKARSSKWSAREVNRLSKEKSWIIEGVYSHLINLAIHRATQVIWLDINFHECLENLKHRGALNSQFILSRVEQYYSRNVGSSWLSHNQIYKAFDENKLRLNSKNEVSNFINGK